MGLAMKQVCVFGELAECSQLINELVARNFVVSLANTPGEFPPETFYLASITNDISNLFDQMKNTPGVWIAWCHGQPDLLSLAYKAGATAAFPHETEVSTLCSFIERYFDQKSQREKYGNRQWLEAVQRHFQRGDLILLDTDVVLEINQGIISKKMIHKDGCEVLLGLFGEGSLILPHPSDDCYIQLVAHTDCVVKIQPVERRKLQEDFPDQLRINLQKTEAWAAMQARPHLDLRLLGILSLLADEFGQTTAEGRLLNIRLTHAQLASATGSTRATITRTIADLKNLGELTTVTTADGERYCLLSWESCSHLSR
jgi:hypothetical protein